MSFSLTHAENIQNPTILYFCLTPYQLSNLKPFLTDTRRWGCQRANKTCLERPTDCTGPRPRGVQTCSRCRCRDEEEWDRCKPPEGRRRWAEDFRELRRRWSEHAKRQSCSCDDWSVPDEVLVLLSYIKMSDNVWRYVGLDAMIQDFSFVYRFFQDIFVFFRTVQNVPLI